MRYINVSIEKEESQYAKSDGEVDGVIKKQRGNLPVYVELGREIPYRDSPNDDPKTEYKFFTGCKVYYAETEEERDKGIFIDSLTKTNTPVKLYF